MVATRETPAGVGELFETLAAYLPEDRVAAIRAAYDFAAAAHEGQDRLSGEPYITHPVAVTQLLADLHMDSSALKAALLHDVIEDCGVTSATLTAKFGADVTRLVEGATKIEHYQPTGPNAATADAETLRKMLLAMAEDVRVVIIKVADRLHNMRTIQFLSPERQRAIAQETMEIYAPLAGRLGMWQMKWQLEDLAFRVLEPEQYRRVAGIVRSRRVERERFMRQVEQEMRAALQEAGINAEIDGRVKHLYSTYNKMRRYSGQGRSFDQIYDLIAVRILVHSIEDCYKALGVVHQTWHPIPGSFDDYIGNPKESLYQSLHSSVLGPSAHPFEVQIRTYEMHEVAEYGVAAHWRYKEDSRGGASQYEERMAWLRHLLEWQQDGQGTDEFLESVKLDVFQDQVFVFTPRGDVRIMPAGSTPIDFAFRVHTDLGYHTAGARVNGRLVPLTTRLQNGDVIEVIRGRGSKGPSRDWLSPDLGYLGTSNARQKVRQWFRREERDENIVRGRDLLERERKRLGFAELPADLHTLVGLDSMESVYEAIGYGGLSVQSVTQKIIEQTAPAITTEARPHVTPSKVPKGMPPVRVLGEGGVHVMLARCCKPIPGDSIVGFVTRSRGVTVHRRECHNIRHGAERERIIECDWAPSGDVYAAAVQVEAWDRVGLLRDISTMVAAEDVNMVGVRTQEHDDRRTTVHLTLETQSRVHLARLMNRLEGLRGVIGVSRTEG